jgi:hypothetical protein
MQHPEKLDSAVSYGVGVGGIIFGHWVISAQAIQNMQGLTVIFGLLTAVGGFTVMCVRAVYDWERRKIRKKNETGT